MNPDDRIDHALRAIAKADASREFSAQVRARIEAGDGVHAAWWPKVAAACAAVLLVAAVAWFMREAPPAPSEQMAQTTAPVVATRSLAPAPPREPRAEPLPWSRSTHVARMRGSVARVTTARSLTGDHERALEPLSPLEALSVPSIAPDAMVVVDHVIAPLAPITPLSTSAM
ncbi:MAG: hypothetical protein JJE40_09270 [Vicinamibacteria bacterium]|nr:hypothetical protein [Vicinamibacteria bacterium]